MLSVSANILSSSLLSRHIKIKIYRTLILPLVLYGCETWLLTLTEEHRLRVYENMMLRRIVGPKRHKVTRKWRRLHNEEFNDLCSSPNTIQVIKSRRMRWAGHAAHMGERKPAYRVLVGKPERKRQPGRPKHRWEDDIKMDLQEVEWWGMDWIDQAQNRDRWRALVNAVMNIWVP